MEGIFVFIAIVFVIVVIWQQFQTQIGIAFLVLIGVGLAWLIITQLAKAAKKQEAERRSREDRARWEREAARKAAQMLEAQRQQHLRLQDELRAEAQSIGNTAIAKFESAAKALESAERHLDEAESHFGERLFDPYWESIERAAGCVAKFRETIDAIGQDAERHGLVRSQIEKEPLPTTFPVARTDVQALGDAVSTIARMKAVIRASQASVEFTTIFHQRKTNQILLAGFSSLGDAISDMGYRLESSLAGVVMAIDESSRKQRAAIEAVGDTIRAAAEEAERRHEDSKEWEKARSAQQAADTERQEKALQLLEDIRERRSQSSRHWPI